MEDVILIFFLVLLLKSGWQLRSGTNLSVDPYNQNNYSFIKKTKVCNSNEYLTLDGCLCVGVNLIVLCDLHREQCDSRRSYLRLWYWFVLRSMHYYVQFDLLSRWESREKNQLEWIYHDGKQHQFLIVLRPKVEPSRFRCHLLRFEALQYRM